MGSAYTDILSSFEEAGLFTARRFVSSRRTGSKQQGSDKRLSKPVPTKPCSSEVSLKSVSTQLALYKEAEQQWLLLTLFSPSAVKDHMGFLQIMVILM